jgi:hypothetical protein
MRLFRLTLLVVATALTLSQGALAATPKQIYRDYADNGRLDAKYSKADLDRALKDAVLQGYGDQNVNVGLSPAAGAAAGNAGASGGLPFTGLDLTLMAVGGGALLLTGAGLRRLARSRK